MFNIFKSLKLNIPTLSCITDYLKITHNTGTIKVCGTKKYSYENRLCSSEIFVSYKAPTNSSSYKGFKLYWEFIDRSSQPNCPTDLPTLPATTSPALVTPMQELLDLAALDIKKEVICKGKELSIEVPSQYVFFPIDIYYGVTSDGTCTNTRY